MSSQGIQCKTKILTDKPSTAFPQVVEVDDVSPQQSKPLPICDMDSSALLSDVDYSELLRVDVSSAMPSRIRCGLLSNLVQYVHTSCACQQWFADY